VTTADAKRFLKEVAPVVGVHSKKTVAQPARLTL